MVVGIFFAGACSGLSVVQIVFLRQRQAFGIINWWVFHSSAGPLGLGTLLGPETTGPFVAPVGVGVLSLHLGGGVWCLFCG